MPEHHHHSHEKYSALKYLGVTVLNGFITLVEVAGGLMSGSLSLLSDAAHNLSDTVSIALSYFAWKVAKKEKDIRRTYGYKRAEIIAAFVNASALLAVCLFLILEAVKRFRNPEPINSGVMMGVALFGLAANLASMLLLKRESQASMNWRSSYLHLFGDTISSVGVLLGGVAIRLWNILWVDPLITILIALYIMKECWEIVSKTVGILMQSAADLDYTAIQKEIEAFPGVESIHHAHTWMANEDTIHFEAHVDMQDCLLSESCDVAEKIESLLKEKYGISHVTLQFESGRCAEKAFFEK